MKHIKLFAILSAFLVLSSCTKTPVAKINLTKKQFSQGEKISFTHSSSDYASLVWNLGNGKEIKEENPSRTFDTSGFYTIYLTAYDKRRRSFDQDVQVIEITLPAISGNYKASDCKTSSYNTTITQDLTYSGGSSYYYSANSKRFILSGLHNGDLNDVYFIQDNKSGRIDFERNSGGDSYQYLYSQTYGNCRIYIYDIVYDYNNKKCTFRYSLEAETWSSYYTVIDNCLCTLTMN